MGYTWTYITKKVASPLKSKQFPKETKKKAKIPNVIAPDSISTSLTHFSFFTRKLKAKDQRRAYMRKAKGTSHN